MELECDLSTIKNEEMLRKMWQQSEDINRKKEIRSHLYKLRESRLRDLYQGDIMSGNNAPGFGKDPLTPCHGDSLVDQSFQSLKSKEIRDSMSPTHDMKFHSMSLNHPNTTGWDVQTSSEVSPDGRAFRSETLATTDGVEKISGGLSEFKGRNEQRSSASHQGDDKNFVKKASESSNTHLQENVVIGDENSGRTEMKMSSTTSSSTSKVVSSSSTVEYDGGEPANRYLMDNTGRQHIQQQQQQHQHNPQQRMQQEQLRQQLEEQHQHGQRISDQQTSTQQRQQQFSEQSNRQETTSQQTSSNVETQRQHEESKRYIDMDKATPEYQQHVQFLMAQPGEVISNTVEYPKPNVKMITTVKRLPDGTIVKNKRYETEELRPGSENTRQRSTTSTNQNNTQQHHHTDRRVHDEDNIQTRLQKSRDNTYTERSASPHVRRPVDVVDNVDTVRHVEDRNIHSDDVANISTSFSSVKKSSRRFSTETTSETIEEFDDRSPGPYKPITRDGQKPQDFSTHGFPSVKPNKQTQEYPTDRPHGARPTDDFTTHGFPSVKPNKPTQEYSSDRPQPVQYNVTDSRKPSYDVNPRGFPSQAKDGEVILVSSETTRTANQKTNRERVIETEFITDGSRPEDFANQGFPAVKASSPLREGTPRQGTPIKDHPSSPRRVQPHEDFSTHGFPSVRSPTKSTPDFPQHGYPSNTKDGEVVLVSSETRRTANQKSNREHVIETVIDDRDYPASGLSQPDKITYTKSPHRPDDYSTHGFPSVRESSPIREGSPRHGTPTGDYPSSPRRSQPSDNYSTNGFPSARSPTRSTPDYSRGSPSTKDAPRSGVKPTQSSPQYKPTTTTKSVTTEATKKLLHKEKEVDAAHRAFAASLRSSSPVDNTRRDSYSDNQRHTPRSSVSSTKTFRRDLREGSHDSTAPSETSRISSNTVTRQSPSKSVGKTVVSKQTVVKTKNANGSNETLDLSQQRSTKSPSPGKTITTTTTTKTTTTRKSPTTEVPKSDNQKTKPAEILFPINEPLTITKNHFSSNDASFPRNEVFEVVEEPCLKKNFYRLGPSDVNTHKQILDDHPAQSQTFKKKITNNDKKTTPPNTDIATPIDIPLQADMSHETDLPEKRESTTLAANEPIEKKTVKHVTYINNLEQQMLHEKSPSSPAPSSSKVRTHPKNQSPMRIDNTNIYDEPINEPSSSYDIEHTDRNQVPSKPQTNNPKNIRQQKEPSVERRTDVRETTFNNHDSSKKFPLEVENQYIDHETQPDDFDESISEPDFEPSYEKELPLYKQKRPNEDQTKKMPQQVETDNNHYHRRNKPSYKPTETSKMQVNKVETFGTTLNTKTLLNEAEILLRQKENAPNVKEAPQKPTAKILDLDDDEDDGQVADKPLTYDESTIIDELFKQTHKTKKNKNINEDFITIERDNPYPKDFESPDGGFVSKESEPVPTSPTFKKKGLSRRETFEERCRHILGMEEDGDTQGTFKPTEIHENDNSIQNENLSDTSEKTHKTSKFEVQIEDCDDDEDDDKPLYISNIKETLETRKDIKTPITVPDVKEPLQPTIQMGSDTDEMTDTEIITKNLPFIEKDVIFERPETRTNDFNEVNVLITEKSIVTSTDDVEKTGNKLTLKKRYPGDISELEQELLAPTKPNKAPIAEEPRSQSPEPKQVNLVTTNTKDIEKTSTKVTIVKQRDQNLDEKIDCDQKLKEPIITNRESGPTTSRSTKNVSQKTPVKEKLRSNSPESKPVNLITKKTIVNTNMENVEKTQLKPKDRYPEEKVESDFEPDETNLNVKPIRSNKPQTSTNVNKKLQVVEDRRLKSPEPKHSNVKNKTTIVTTEKITQVKPKHHHPGYKVVSDLEQEKSLTHTKPRPSANINQNAPIVEKNRTKSPDLKKAQTIPDSSSEVESDSPQYTSDVETEQENFISEKVINCNDIVWIEEEFVPEYEKTKSEKINQKVPSTNLGPGRKTSSKSPSKIQSRPRELSPIKQKPNEPSSKLKQNEKSFVSGKPDTKFVDDRTDITENRKTSKTSTTSTVKTTAKHVISNKEEIISNNRTHNKYPKQPSMETTPKSAKKNLETTTSTIKDRLRSSPRKHTSKKDDVDANSSPDTSPTRFTEQRRSSNISVHTEIIIDHAAPKSPKKNESTPNKSLPKSQNQTTTKEFTFKNDKTNRKLPVTERKESAPVHRVTRKDKDVKMLRSTSENVIKVTGKPTKKPEMNSLSPVTSKPERRPGKCFTTKTINLTTTNKVVNRDDMENIIIDIQHAKSSREPSPDKIVPTPVPTHLDTGKPRYPDVVQEPEDEPKKKPVVKNIPIFEEETNDFVNCQISEIQVDKTATSSDFTDYEILDNPTVEAPQSLDYPLLDKTDDDCLLSVHEKVNKFTHTAEEVNKPKASSPFNRDFETTHIVIENDDCLLTVDQKVNKFLKTAESITKHPITPVREIERPNFDDLDEELRQDECTLSVLQKVNKFINTAEKLAPAAPQKSPELVARIERNISKQSEPEPSDKDDDETIPFSPKHTVEIEMKRQKNILSRPSTFDKNKPKNKDTEYTNYEVLKQNNVYTTDKNNKTVIKNIIKVNADDVDELVPMTKTHTTSIELKRQKDILSRPSVFESRKTPESVLKKSSNKSNVKPNDDEEAPKCCLTKPHIVSEQPHRFDNTKPSYTDKKSPQYQQLYDDETTTTSEIKTHKDTHTEITKTNESKTNKYHNSRVLTTRSQFETKPKDNTISRRKPSTESDKPKKIVTENVKQLVVFKRKPSTDSHRNTEDEDDEYQLTKTSTEEITVSSQKNVPKTMERKPESPQNKDNVYRKSFDKKYTNPNEVSHSPTSSPSRSTNTTLNRTTERTLKHTSRSKSPENKYVEPILEQPMRTKPSPLTSGRSKVITETVAARRNIFEKGVTSKPSKSPTPVPTGRRPSYMDHTKSSLEHTRRDSLELNKSNYSRKSSIDEDVGEQRPHSAVKFDVPQRSRKEPSISEDINIEEIFELELLEQLLETVTSYEIRRRIRAQIRLVKKNMINTQSVVDKNKSETKLSNAISSTHKSSTYSSTHYEETDALSNRKLSRNLHDRSHSSKRQHERSHSPKGPTDVEYTVETVTVCKEKNADKPRHRSHSPDEQTIRRSSKGPTDHSHSPKGPIDVPHHLETVTISTDRFTKKPRDRSHSPDAKTVSSSLKEVRRVLDSQTTNKSHTFTEETDMVVVHSPRLVRKYPATEVSHSPERPTKALPNTRSYSPEHKQSPKSYLRNPSYENNKKPLPRERSISPDSKIKSCSRKDSTSPDGKSTMQSERSRSPSTKSTRQQEYSTTSKATSVKTTTHSPDRKPITTKANDKTPIWADRKNILKNQSATGSITKKTPLSPKTRTTASTTKTVKSSTTTTSQQQQQSQRNKAMQEEDSIISSYGIGPTDENGLPLFGIRALKKKKPATQPCETTDEVTGYVVEEKYYSDSKTKPIVERKELIYSTNAGELDQIKSEIESKRTSSDDGVVRRYQKVDKDFIQNEPKAILPSNEEFSTSSTRYTTRRGSVKEMSEKFIRKESSQSITEKSSGYPKAGLILRTNSRKGSVTDAADSFESENYNKTTSEVIHQHHQRSGDEEDPEGEYEFSELQQRSVRMLTESESECESSNLHHEINKKSSSSSTSTRSFLNTTGESKIVTGVDDVLERMRNADNVVEEGDTAEDQEARSLLNKFLGASVIMRGVETVLPPTTKQTKTTTSYVKSDGGDNSRKQEVKTTRVTKTIQSGSSSSPVTRTTCAIEEIWDEEILKELLEQAKTYEERRKIRARLRELMAEREEKKIKVGEKSAPAVTEPEVEEAEESSASEYEEIIEEVTDSSETEAEEEAEKEKAKEQVAETKKSEDVSSKEKEIKAVEEPSKAEKDNLKKSLSNESFKSAEATTTIIEENSQETVSSKKVTLEETQTAAASEILESAEIAASASASSTQSQSDSTTEQTDSSEDKGEKGESLIPLLQDLLHKNMPQIKIASNQQSTNTSSSIKNIQTYTKNKTNTNRTCAAGNNVANCSIESSMLTVSNNNNTNNNTTTNTKKTNRKDQQQQPTLQTTNTTATVTAVTNDSDKIRLTVDSGSNSSGSSNQVDRLSVPQKEDSGTESGEDLRLIAAGLRDKLHMQSDSDLIQEVTTALSRLESSLKEGKEIPVDGNKRKALLALVERLQTGLTSPEKLAATEAAMAVPDMEGNNEIIYDETSSPEADAHRGSRQRFAKRRNRNNRHTVGVSREELADARRYMEDMIMMDSISNCTTPDSSLTTPSTPPQWYPIEKNASSGAILTNNQPLTLFRPNQFLPSNIKNSTECLSTNSSVNQSVDQRKTNANKKQRPLSGNFSVSFEEQNPENNYNNNGQQQQIDDNTVPIENERTGQNASPDAAFKSNRFTNKKQLMKRANTIDIPKTKKYNPDFDTDSEVEDKGPLFGLKRTVQVNVKQKVRSAVPPFEPKTENDHKFLAFINKQSAKPGLGWNSSRSVSNWTNKFGSIKHNFEVGAAATATTGKPPQVPGHVPQNAAKNYWNKQVGPPHQQQDYSHHQHNPSTIHKNQSQSQDYSNIYNANTYQQNIQRNQQEAIERQKRQINQQEAIDRQKRLEKEAFDQQRRIEKETAEQRQRKLEKERIERERIEMDRFERQRQERERIERDRLEREFYEKERLQRENLAAEKHAAMPSMTTVPKTVPVNKFIHAPQSVFRPIENNDIQTQKIYKPIPQMPHKTNNTWQPPTPPTIVNKPPRASPQSVSSPQYLLPKQSVTSPPYVSSTSPSVTSPIGLPWVSKPTVNNDFKNKANKFEERSLNDRMIEEREQQNRHNPNVQRHNSLRTAKVNPQQFEEHRKRPSLPNAADPYLAMHSQYAPQPAYFSNERYQPPPPPTNVSFTYADYTPKVHYQSYPCLPTAVDIPLEYPRSREDSLTNPEAVPLVLTSANTSYSPNFDTSQPKLLSRQFDYVSPLESAPNSPSVLTMPQTDYTDDDLDSDSNMLEYRAEAKVMGKPQSQTAVTVGRRTAYVSDDEVFGKNSRAAKSLLHTMKNLGGSNNGNKLQKEPLKKPEPPTSPKVCISPDGRSYQAPVVEPLFPQITNFEANRSPMYNKKSVKSTSAQYQKPPSYIPPMPQPTERVHQSQEFENSYNEKNIYTDDQFRNHQHIVQPPSLTAEPRQNIAPYISETQTSYIVTYPVDDDLESHDSSVGKKPYPTSLPLQRIRNLSENSNTSSSISYNLPSPNTSWTTNPVHGDDKVEHMRRKSFDRQKEKLINTTHYSSQQSIPNSINSEYEAIRKPAAATQKPDLAPKPQLPPLNIRPKQQLQQQQQQKQHTNIQQYTPPVPNQQLSPLQQPSSPLQPTLFNKQSPQQLNQNKSLHQETQQQHQHIQQQNHHTKHQQIQQHEKQYTPPTVEQPKLSTKSQTITSSNQSYEQYMQKSHPTMIRQRTIDGGSMTTLQTQDRILSQQSLLTKQQQQYTQQHEITEMRRKSLGNVLDIQQQQRKTAYYESQQNEINQAYKSSAPSDTPDIVKSSLPKDENMPILKKFGPPQRHHYMPNAYQSPVNPNANQISTITSSTSQTQTTKQVTSNKNIMKSTQREVLQHSTLTTKPAIVETPATPQPTEDLIPRNIVFNNVSAFTSMSRRQAEVEYPLSSDNQPRPNRLSKCDSWNQIVEMQSHHVPQPTAPKFNSGVNELRRTKSGHSLAIPKMYEAGIDKAVISEKQKTVAAYFSGNKSPNTMVKEEQQQQNEVIVRKSAINRTKTSEKVSASRKSLNATVMSSGAIIGGGLSRSATMPHIANLNLLDESNVEDSFEQLMMEQQHSTSTTEKTETKEKDGAVVTTTTKVTTRTITGGAAAPKPVSPFAKFRQLDKQNSVQSPKSPSTPTTPGGGTSASPSSGSAPIFKFTDPALNARAATVKDQLLQWCQIKTKEYENVQITNFSTSWSDGLAFCALIHHFLPDAFDYTKLTQQSRRHNFELAFTVADEKAGIAPLLDVEDMVEMRRPDWKCVFVYVQSIYRRFRNCQ